MNRHVNVKSRYFQALKKVLTVGDHGAFVDLVVDDIGPEHQLLAVVVVQADGVPQAWHQ